MKASKDPKQELFVKVPKFETDEEVFANRLALRFYFRDIFRNMEILKGMEEYE
jgi:hypothetical protein